MTSISNTTPNVKTAPRLEDVPIEKIKLGDRHRDDLGDIDTLAESIRDVGLLQPIGVDPYYTLIFGERRLVACEQLGWETVPCIVLSLESILAGEYAENEFRKQFTPSERAAIGKAIEAELGTKERRGNPQFSAIAEDSPKGNSVDIAAKRAGFKSAETYERAQKVVELGAPELVQAMDAGDLSISAAAAIASQPKADQAAIVAMPKDERATVVRQIRETRADREADERHARDLRVFRQLHDCVEFVARFSEDSKETWAGLSRVAADTFSENLPRAIQCLVRLDKAHPNEPRKPKLLPSPKGGSQ